MSSASQAAVLALALLAGCASVPGVPDPASDAPDRRYVARAVSAQPASYAQALLTWRHPEDVNAWIGANFQYDVDRAVALSESQRAAGPAPAILEPQAFYDRPEGMCVDLARFGVETLLRIAPEVRPRYLMIEFDPASLQGQVVRRHWVAVYENAEGVRVIADSRRPGFDAGPYPTVEAFVAEYAAYRGRRIVSYRELETFQRRSRVQAIRRQADS